MTDRIDHKRILESVLDNLPNTLASYGIIQRAAVDDPDGYDNGEIMRRVEFMVADIRSGSND